MPFNFFDDSETQNFFDLINKNINFPKRTKLTDMFSKEFQVVQENLKSILSKNESKFSFTVDAWTALNKNSYYGITIHFIDESWHIVPITLDVVASKGRRAGVDIAKQFLKVLEEYHLKEDVMGITVDNVAANTKFMEHFGKFLSSYKKFCYILYIKLI